MANVWKIGSRWSDNGSWDSRIISIFRRSSTVFVGTNTERFLKEVKKGDYFAIADGYDIPAVAKVMSESPIPLNKLISKQIIKVRPNEPFDTSEDWSNCYGVRVKIVDLPPDSRIWYEKRGTFCKATSIADKVKSLYHDNLSSKFDIKSSTYRILSTQNQNDGKLSIIDKQTFYNIPVYQREYSWGEDQVNKFVSDIFNGFWGNSETKQIICEPMFIGTMQLSYKKYISTNESEQDVIDGQQRISTIICILKYLKLSHPGNKTLSSIDLNWFETRVNNGKEEDYLTAMLNVPSLDQLCEKTDHVPNRYLRNLDCISKSFAELTTDENNRPIPDFEEHFQEFIEYFLNCIYFVVVETVAGLSKTIQIFNTINTAGLDLSGNDIFKVRLYEYLHDVKNADENAFNEIGDIYKNVKDLNTTWRKTHDYDVISIDRIRSVYKDYLTSKYRLPVSLYSKSTDSFFEELFDVLLNVQSHQEMKDLKGLELSLNDLDRISKVVYLWNSSGYRSVDDYLSYSLIERSRYSKYLQIVYLILLQNEKKEENERLSDVYDILSLLSKMFFCWSIQFAKSVNEIHTFMNKIYREVIDFQNKRKDILKAIRTKIREKNKDCFRTNCIGQPIVDNRTWKDLICFLSAFFDEKNNNIAINEVEDKFSGGYDIEHIHANANTEEGEDIPYGLQNSIGNLMVLEYDINRSIGCLPFKEKVDRSDGKLCYKNSHFMTVKKVRVQSDWLLEQVEERLKSEIKKISTFLFE